MSEYKTMADVDKAVIKLLAEIAKQKNEVGAVLPTTVRRWGRKAFELLKELED